MSYLARFLNWTSPDKPKNDDKQFIGIGGFKMYVAISETTNFAATAPDIVCEDLTTVQDSIINSPKTYSLVGEVADIFIENKPEVGLPATVEKILNIGTPYIPDRTLSQIQKVQDQISTVKSVIDNVDNVLGDVQEVFDIVGNKSPSASIKEDFLNKIERSFDTKTLVNIELTSGVRKQVLITSSSYTETNDGDTGDFSLSFKEIRIASIGLFRDNQEQTPAEEAKAKPNSTVGGQFDSVTDKGISDGIQTTQEKAAQVFESIGFSNIAEAVGGL